MRELQVALRCVQVSRLANLLEINIKGRDVYEEYPSDRPSTYRNSDNCLSWSQTVCWGTVRT